MLCSGDDLFEPATNYYYSQNFIFLLLIIVDVEIHDVIVELVFINIFSYKVYNNHINIKIKLQ